MLIARDAYLSFDLRTGVSLLALAAGLAAVIPREAAAQACSSGADVTLSGSCTGTFNWTGGNLVNLGTISGGGTGVQAFPSNVGTLTNRGTISGTLNGFDTDNNGINVTSIVNSGTINGIGQDGIYAEVASFGTITNTAFGTISGSRSGLYFTAYSPGATLINNQGTITGGSYGLYNDTAGFGGTLTLNNSGTIIATGAGGTGLYNSGTIGALNNSGTIRGQLYAIDDQSSGGMGTITNSGTIAGNIRSSSTLTINGGSAFGTLIGYDLSSAGLIDTSVIFGSGNIALGDNISGTVTINGARVRISNTVNIGGAITLNGGVLDVEGTITGTPSVTVNGGVLMGAGTVDPLLVTIASGGTFAPGNGAPGSSTAIVGDLLFQTGATYQVQIGSGTTSFSTVTGTATLGGATVSAVLSGSLVKQRYTILTATGGVVGSFSPTVAGLPPAFHAVLGYDANDVYIYFDMVLPGGGNLNGNQQSVGNAVLNYYKSNGSIPVAFGQLTPAGLTQVSGELSTRTQQTTVDAMGQFLGLLADPALGGSSRAPSDSSCPSLVRNAAAAAPARPAADGCAVAAEACDSDPRWSFWARSFSSAQSANGSAAAGSNAATSTIYGMAVGADHLVTPTTLAGVAIAWAGTGFSVENGGSGRSDLFQFGLYGRQSLGPAYLSAALGYGRQDITTERTVTVAGADFLRARYSVDSWSGRVEGGWRFAPSALAGFGVTPYAAGQVTLFNQPAYAESVVSGAGNFALAYAAKSQAASRAEIGLRPDKSFDVPDGVFTLRGKVAWAHDFNTERSAVASFQALPGTSFVVNGAPPASDSVLASASAEMKWNDGWSLAASFDGEFSGTGRSFGAKGVVRYRW